MKKKQHVANYEYLLDKLCDDQNSRSVIKLREAINILENSSSIHHYNKVISLATALTLIELKYDPESVTAAILMYVPNKNKSNIENIFGLNINKLISGVSLMGLIDKISNKTNRCKVQLSNLHKLLLAMVNDPRVIIIKLAEQLCKLNYSINNNGQTLAELANRNMEIYAPLANKLGMGNLKLQIEDAAFGILNPTEYKEIVKSIKSHTNERERLIAVIIRNIEDELSKISLQEYDIYGRAKHSYSIFKKMHRKNIEIDKIYDSIAIRILVPSIDNCYEVLSIIHTLWDNIPDEFDDYISNPKSNGYSSLHTAVSNNKHQFEIQIRTFQMHEEAEYGIAAHWIYKSQNEHESITDQKTKWLREILEWKDQLSTTTNIENTNIVDNRVYVFTPLGDVIDLPNGSTPIDFAYAIHTDVGHKCRGAKLHNKIVSLDYHLKTGDQLTILTQNKLSPSRDWLVNSNKYIKTAKARIKITQWFNQHDIDMLRDMGKSNFDKTTKKLNLQNINIDKFAQNLNFKKADDLFISIGRGEIKLNSILQSNNNKIQTSKSTASKTILSSTKVQIHGIGDISSTIAKCCMPTKKDNIIGYISQSKGILIHTVNCPNILRKKGSQINKLLQVHWSSQYSKQKFYFMEITAHHSKDILNELHDFFAENDFDIISFQTTLQDSDKILVNACLQSSNHTKKSLSNIKETLMSEKNIIYLICNI